MLNWWFYKMKKEMFEDFEKGFSLRKILEDAEVTQIEEKIKYLKEPRQNRKKITFKPSRYHLRGNIAANCDDELIKLIGKKYPDYVLLSPLMRDKGLFTNELSTKVSQQKRKGLDFIKLCNRWLINKKDIDLFIRSFKKFKTKKV